jgi:hypothetical protein
VLVLGEFGLRAAAYMLMLTRNTTFLIDNPLLALKHRCHPTLMLLNGPAVPFVVHSTYMIPHPQHTLTPLHMCALAHPPRTRRVHICARLPSAPARPAGEHSRC